MIHFSYIWSQKHVSLTCWQYAQCESNKLRAIRGQSGYFFQIHILLAALLWVYSIKPSIVQLFSSIYSIHACMLIISSPFNIFFISFSDGINWKLVALMNYVKQWRVTMRILKIDFFSSCMLALKRDTEERRIPDELKYWKKHHSEYCR